MNAKKKGDKVENEVVAILDKQGFLTMKSPRTMKRIWTPKGAMYVSQANDYFGLFDVIALSRSRSKSWIQVKSNVSDVSKAKKEISKFADIYMDDTDFIEIWLRVARKGFVIFTYTYGDWVKHYLDLKGDKCDKFIYSSR